MQVMMPVPVRTQVQAGTWEEVDLETEAQETWAALTSTSKQILK
jgi:hypothetical protein